MIWQFTDNGGGEVSKVKIKIDKTEEMYSLEKFIEAGKDWDQKTWFWKGKLSTLFNSAEFLRIAPCITTELYTSVSEQGEIIRAFKTEKVSNEFVYYIIYNT